LDFIFLYDPDDECQLL